MSNENTKEKQDGKLPVSGQLPNDINLLELKKLLMFSDRYEISIQFWPDQIAVYIAKDGVDLKDFGGDFDFAVTRAIEYLVRITGSNPDASRPYTKECPSCQDVMKATTVEVYQCSFCPHMEPIDWEQQPQSIDPFENAPEWAKWRFAKSTEIEMWCETKPTLDGLVWVRGTRYQECPDRRLTYSDWEQSPVKRQQ